MSYIKLKIPGDKPTEVGLKFGYLSFKMIKTSANRDVLIGEDGMLNIDGISKVIYSGYYNNCMNKNVEMQLLLEDFSRVVDKMAETAEGVESLKAIIECWTQSEDVQGLIKETSATGTAANDEKKTPAETLTDSNNSATENLE